MRAVVTGGLGFIGSNLAIRLVRQGTHVTIVDSSVDIGEAAQFSEELAQADVIFNLAGEISHINSMLFPERDLQLNTVAQLRFLLECSKVKHGVRVVYASTRQIYGAPDYLPVDERHPIRPIDFNGIHKAAACMYHLMMSRTGELDAIVLRLTNVYGPRIALNVPAQGFLSTFLRRALAKDGIEIFGDGRQLRDPVYVDDVVDAFLLAGSVSGLRSRAYNVGGAETLSLRQIAEATARVAGGLDLSERSFPNAIKPIDIGSYHSDCSLIRRELGWTPRISFEEGLRRTLAYYA
jgi:UDP-glucose 4-epimerase